MRRPAKPWTEPLLDKSFEYRGAADGREGAGEAYGSDNTGACMGVVFRNQYPVNGDLFGNGTDYRFDLHIRGILTLPYRHPWSRATG